MRLANTIVVFAVATAGFVVVVVVVVLFVQISLGLSLFTTEAWNEISKALLLLLFVLLDFFNFFFIFLNSFIGLVLVYFSREEMHRHF